eukprot:jgi/Orpsp1_1/1183450/evm.model.c7180000085256.1
MTSEILEQNSESSNEIVDLSEKKSNVKKAMRKEFEVKPENIITNIVVWAAKERHPLAMYLMGIFFLGYYKVNPDFEKAVFWFKRAIKYNANKDFGGVEYYLGHCYENGFGIPQDTEKALELYNVAANKKFPKAMKKLSVCYAKGFLGCDVDKELSNKWDKMYEEQEKYVWNMDSDLTNAGYKVDMFAGEEQLVDIIEDAREVGNIEAEYCLGLFYDAGFGGIIERNEKLALQCFRSAAIKGHAGALYCLAKYTENGKGGCEKQPDVAMGLYREAAINGDQMAKEIIESYKNMPMDDETRAMVKEARRQRMKEEKEEELARKNTSKSSRIKSKIQTVHKVVNKSSKKDKGKAPEDNIKKATTNNSLKNKNVSKISLISNNQNNGSSSSTSNLIDINNSVKINSKRTGKQSSISQLSPLIEEAYTEEIMQSEPDTSEIEINKAPLYPINELSTEPESELNEEEKRNIIENKVKLLSKEYNIEVKENKDNEEINENNNDNNEAKENYNEEVIKENSNDKNEVKESNNEKIIKENDDDNNEIKVDNNGNEIKEVNDENNNDNDKEMDILENEIIGSEFDENDKNIYNIPESEKKIEDEIINKDNDNKSKTKKSHKILNKIKDFGIKTKHTSTKLEKMDDVEQETKESKTIKEKTKESLKEFNKDVKNVSIKTNEKTKKGFKKLANKTEEIGNDLKEGKVGKGIKNFGEKTKIGFKNLSNKNKTKELDSEMKNDINSVSDNVDENNNNNINKEEVKDNINSSNKKLKYISEKTKDGFKNLSSKTKELGNDMKDSIERTSSKIGDSKVGQGYKNFTEKTKEGIKNLSNKTKELGGDMKSSNKNIPDKNSSNDIEVLAEENLKNDEDKNNKEIEKECDKLSIFEDAIEEEDNEQTILDEINKFGKIEETKENNENLENEIASSNTMKRKDKSNSRKSFGLGFKKLFKNSSKK